MPDFFFDNRGNRIAAGLSKRQASPNVWYDCPWESLRDGSQGGQAYFDDFNFIPLIGTQTTQIGNGQYKLFATSGSSVAPVITVNSVATPGGILGFSVDSSANSASLAQAYPSFIATGLQTTMGKLWFEARVACTSVVTNRIGWMIGLAETTLWTLATGVPYSSNAGAITNGASFLGFEHLPADTTEIRTARSDRATSFTETGSAQGTLAAYTFTNLAFTIDPADFDSTRMVRFYQNNIELGTAMSKTTLTGCTNLDANNLGLIIAAVAGSGVSSDIFFVDWVRIAQQDVAL